MTMDGLWISDRYAIDLHWKKNCQSLLNCLSIDTQSHIY